MSPIFEGMITMTKDESGPAMLVLDKDVQFQDLQNLVEYIYTGSTVVPLDRMYSFLQLGHRFQVAGFASSHPQEQSQSFEENEAEIAETISNNMRASGFAEPPPEKEVIVSKEKEVSPAVQEKKVPKAKVPATTKRGRGRQSEGGTACKYCSKLCKTKQSAIVHETRSCGANPNLEYYTCPVCNKTIKPSSMYHHKMSHFFGSKGSKETSSKRSTV